MLANVRRRRIHEPQAPTRNSSADTPPRTASGRRYFLASGFSAKKLLSVFLLDNEKARHPSACCHTGKRGTSQIGLLREGDGNVRPLDQIGADVPRPGDRGFRRSSVLVNALVRAVSNAAKPMMTTWTWALPRASLSQAKVRWAK